MRITLTRLGRHYLRSVSDWRSGRALWGGCNWGGWQRQRQRQQIQQLQQDKHQ
jgi:hypothetical protein